MYRLPRPSTICIENGDETGGQGGALHSSLDATTILRAKSVMRDNTAGNGGAIYNRSGRITLRKVSFNGNQALVRHSSLRAGGLLFDVSIVVVGNSYSANPKCVHAFAVRPRGTFFEGRQTEILCAPSVPVVMKNIVHELQGGDRADGGHVHTEGEVSISNKAVFKAGFARAGVRSCVCALSVVYFACAGIFLQCT